MVSTKLTLYTHKTLSDGKHPIVMMVIYQRKKRMISIGFQATAKSWNKDKKRFRRTVENYETKNIALRRYELLAEKIVDDTILSGKPFSFPEFKRKFTGKQSTTNNFIEFCEELMGEMETAGNEGNRKIYRNVRNSLVKFNGGKQLNFEDINVTFLNKYEAYLASDKSDRKGCAPSTMNQYIRTIAAIFNKAISRDVISADIYPFRNQFNPKGYSLAHLKSQPNYRALSPEELEKFKNFDAEKYPKLRDAYYYFMFMYYCRGLNWTDLCHLQHSDIRNDRIYYNRKKTGKHFSIKLSDHLKEIIAKFDHPLYVFPILSDFHKTAKQKGYRIKKCIRKTNSDLKMIAMRLSIEPDISTYTARHTYAMSLKRAGIRLSVISDAMGHADSKVTQHYLSRFEDDVIDESDKVL